MIFSQVPGVRRFLGQNGNVAHWQGRTGYILQPSLYITKSPLANSTKLYLESTFFKYFLPNSFKEMPKYLAIFLISSLDTHVYPGSPRQHLPHFWHLKRKPSLYQQPLLLLACPVRVL